MPLRHQETSGMSLSSRLSRLYGSPGWLLVVVAFVVLLVNLAVKYILSSFPVISLATSAVLEVVLDLTLLVPILLVFFFRPLVLHMNERDQAAEMLRKSEQKYRQLVDTLQEGIWAIDADNMTTFVNRRMAEMLDRTPEEIEGRHLFDFMDEQGVEICTRNLARCRQGIEEQHDFELLKKDGNRIYTSMSTAPLVDEYGAYNGAIAGVTDITDRRKADDELRRQEELLRVVLAALPVGVWILDRGGTILSSNPAADDIWCGTRHVTMDRYGEYKAWWADSGKAIEPGDWAAARVVRSGESSFNEVIDIESFDGTRKTVLNSAVPITGTGGDITGIVVVNADITELRRVNEQVRKLSRAVEQSPSAVVIADQEGRIEYVNPGFTRLTGYEPAEVLGRNPEILTVDRTSTQEVQDIWDTIFAGAEWHGELLNRKKNGESFWATVAIAPIFSAEGGITHFVGILEDITGRKQAEEELLSSRQRLRDLMAYLQRVREEERTTIAREIHDELGQVLATVQIGVSLLAEEYRDHSLLTEKISGFEQMLEGAIKTVQRIAAELRPVMLDVLGLGEAIEWQAQEFQKKTGIPCTANIILQQEQFEADVATAIFRIFQETLTNVMRHSGASRVQVTLEERKNRLVLMVSDNGRGITRKQLGDRRSLGIMGMRERAYALGGRMRIFGTPEQGTVAMVLVPVKPSGEEP